VEYNQTQKIISILKAIAVLLVALGITIGYLINKHIKLQQTSIKQQKTVIEKNLQLQKQLDLIILQNVGQNEDLYTIIDEQQLIQKKLED